MKSRRTGGRVGCCAIGRSPCSAYFQPRIPPGLLIAVCKVLEGIKSRRMLRSLFADDIVITCRECEVISMSLISLRLDPGQITTPSSQFYPLLFQRYRKMSFSRLSPLFLWGTAVGSLDTMERTRGGGSLAATAGLTQHTHTHARTLNTNLCGCSPSPLPAERTGLAEYSRGFQFFRQVCEPPPIMRRHHTRGSKNFNSR